MATLLAEFQAKFDVLARSLRSSFCVKPTPGSPNSTDTLLRDISFVFNHKGLCEMNILINFETGNIAGVVD